MASIESRLAALAAAVERRQFAKEGDTDPLSRSMFDFEDWFLSLDELGKVAFLAELNRGDPDFNAESLGLTMADLEDWASDIRENRKFIW